MAAASNDLQNSMHGGGGGNQTPAGGGGGMLSGTQSLFQSLQGGGCS